MTDNEIIRMVAAAYHVPVEWFSTPIRYDEDRYAIPSAVVREAIPDGGGIYAVDITTGKLVLRVLNLMTGEVDTISEEEANQ